MLQLACIMRWDGLGGHSNGGGVQVEAISTIILDRDNNHQPSVKPCLLRTTAVATLRAVCFCSHADSGDHQMLQSDAH